ncbi:DnaJ and TPR domain protein [Talaromyces proteolyticus]|uniref:Tetratricopeptide repeat and J domain-containing co-chaperone DNJ1 n=1 Tax=Talaromyces proteolyticus TaxID=1131652 RepID=A0AAD4PU48_9EURO|nr:DnaJ and TPR domain protein [Talaromyces proteolyticus]KAH8688877.1 DnaJ and TPR domain protein [Talaromyces proteolyticus]
MLLTVKTPAILLACLGVGSCLQASDIPADTPVLSLVASAKSHLAGGSPRDALVYFDAAVARDPTNYLTIFQRGATYLSLGRDAQATDDFNRVLELKPDFDGALLQRARIKAKIADWSAAKEDFIAAGKQSTPEFQELEAAHVAEGAAEKAEARGDWEACVDQAGIAISKAPMSLSLRQLRSRCRFEKGDIQEALSDLTHILHLSPGSIEPHLQISSTLFYSYGDTERATAQIRKCLHSDPDSKSCSRLFRTEKKLIKQLDQVREFMGKRKFSNTINLLVGKNDENGLIDDVKEEVKEARELGRIHPNAPNQLYESLVETTCEAYRAINSPKKAETYCSEALTANPHSLHGLLHRAQAQLEADEFEKAIETLNTAKEHHQNSNEVQEMLRKAQMLLKRSKQKDYYKVLGVARDADDRTIKRAYRQLTKLHHPDKAVSKGVTKEDAEKKMASINEAYEVLSDSELRTRYDNGDDPNDPEAQRGQPFQGHPGFGGQRGGGQQFFFQQGGGGPQFKFSGQGFNFPGGFPF